MGTPVLRLRRASPKKSEERWQIQPPVFDLVRKPGLNICRRGDVAQSSLDVLRPTIPGGYVDHFFGSRAGCSPLKKPLNWSLTHLSWQSKASAFRLLLTLDQIATPADRHSSGDWDVHRGYGILTFGKTNAGKLCLPGQSKHEQGRKKTTYWRGFIAIANVILVEPNLTPRLTVQSFEL